MDKRSDIEFDQLELLSKAAAKTLMKVDQAMNGADLATKEAAVAQKNVDQAITQRERF